MNALDNHPERYKRHIVLYMETRESDIICTGKIYDNLEDAAEDVISLHYKMSYANVGAYLWCDTLKNSKIIKNLPTEETNE
jgi:hypothetical protein